MKNIAQASNPSNRSQTKKKTKWITYNKKVNADGFIPLHILPSIFIDCFYTNFIYCRCTSFHINPILIFWQRIHKTDTVKYSVYNAVYSNINVRKYYTCKQNRKWSAVIYLLPQLPPKTTYFNFKYILYCIH